MCIRDELFENPNAGASKDAAKVLALLTDGHPSDSDKHEILKMYKVKKITLLVVAVSCDLGVLSDTLLSNLQILHLCSAMATTLNWLVVGF